MKNNEEYTEEEKKITGNFMYGGKRHDAICDYFENAGYNEKEINDISMGIWKGIESERIVANKQLAQQKAMLDECMEIAELGNCICEQIEAYYKIEKNFKIENCAEAVLMKKYRAFLEKKKTLFN